ncbi:MAG: hypothetical protein QME79_05760 [Bacillota bacterium]|nr:hypothetical protein [Bacillota bacterium]
MPRKKDIYRNKVDFGREEFATELYKPAGRPRPREASSDKAQWASGHNPGTGKDVKVPIDRKDTR